jgi:hypothetical protein
VSGHLDYAAVGRVLDAVRAAGLEPPSAAWPAGPGSNEVDVMATSREWRRELSQRVSWAYTFHALGPDLRSDARSSRRTKNLADVNHLANRLLALIRDDDMPLSGNLGHHLDPEVGESIDAALLGLEAIAFAAREEVKRRRIAGIADKAVSADAKDGSLEWGTSVEFVSRLAGIFEQAFGSAAAITYDKKRKPVVGPFVMFVTAVVGEMKKLGDAPPMKVTPGAIDQAFKRGRRGVGQTL